MKINASEILYDSRSLLSQTKDKTVYTLDNGGWLTSKDKTAVTDRSVSRSAAYYRTGESDTVAIRDEARTMNYTRTEASSSSQVDLGDHLDRSLYLGAVMDWAADTIDKVVDAFEKKALADSVNHAAGSSPGTRLLADDGTLDHGVAHRFDFYRQMADQFREKADAIRSLTLGGGGVQIMQTRLTEKEEILVRASGTVQTADGQTIDFSMDLGMKRVSEVESRDVVEVIDPLVINYGGGAVELSSQTMAFDLDSDGKAETVSRLKTGSGFLALDLNQDNQINNGQELFGAVTGDGFSELAFYDQDGNNWIDENDGIYDQLLIWSMDEQGRSRLEKLSQAGIGAIHLGSVTSEFILKGDDTETLGQVRSTGMALTESGEARSVQQIDLKV